MVKKKTLKENFGSHNKETFNRLTTKDICTWNITHNMEITAVWNMKPDRWGSSLFQEYLEVKACGKRQK